MYLNRKKIKLKKTNRPHSPYTETPYQETHIVIEQCLRVEYSIDKKRFIKSKINRR